MKIQEKISRWKDLDKIEYPTPDQIEERLKLEEEIELEIKDTGLDLNHLPKVEQEDSVFKQSKNDQPELKKQKMTIYEKYIKPRIQGKPMTWDQVQQLKLEALGTRLKRHIAEDKAKMRQAKADRFNAIFSMVTGGRDTSPGPSKRSKSKKGSNKEADDLRSILGTNDPTRFDKLLKK